MHFESKTSNVSVRRGGPRSSRRRNRGGSAVSASSRNDSNTIIKMVATPLFPPRSKHMMLPYYLNSSLSVPSTTAAVSYVLSANGLYDPDISGTGIQPMGFDQMMIFYEHYTVYQATLTVTFRNFSATIAPVVFLAVRGDVTNVPDAATVMTTGNTVSTVLMPANVTGSLKELKMHVKIAEFLGFDDLQDSNVARGDIAANPAEGAFFHVGAFYNETTTAGTVQFQARITYDAVFSEARIITPSLRLGFKKLIEASREEEFALVRASASSLHFRAD